MEGLSNSHESGEKRYLEDYDGDTTLQITDVVRDITHHTRRITDLYTGDMFEGELRALLSQQGGVEPQEIQLDSAVQVCDEFHSRYPEGVRMSVTGVGLVVVRYPEAGEVAVAPLDGGARLIGEFRYFTALDAPAEDDIAHVIADMECERCESGDHDLIMTPAMHLSNARIESLHDGSVLMEFDSDEFVCAPMNYETLTFGYVVDAREGLING